MENKNLKDTGKQLELAHFQLKGGERMAEQKYESQGYSHWQSRVECISAPSQPILAKKLNEFYVDKWVVGTQVFRNDDGWNALVYYKVKE
jgi:hypothetical protein